jgi:hypothetical protein
MKRIAIAVCVVVLVFAVAALAQTPVQPKSGSVEQELIKLENGWNDAQVKKDGAFLNQILADDYSGTESDGNVLTKAQEIANLKYSIIKSVVNDDYKVRIYGDVAVVTYTSKWEAQDRDNIILLRFTNTWVKRAGRWQCVASHGSAIAPK